MKRKIKFKPIIILIIIILSITFGVNKIIEINNYHKTYEYKFIQNGYTKEEYSKLDNLSDKTKDYLLNIDYSSTILNLIDEKYFIEKNLKKYLEYYKENKEELSKIVAIVNVGVNKDFYSEIKKTDTSLNELMLVNKYYYLDNTYNSDNMVSVSNTYSYGSNHMLTKEAFNAFLNMWNKAKEEDLYLIINSSYRSYEDQDEIYEYYKELKGDEYADSIAARPGHSEHQTGLAIDIQTYGSTGATFEEFDEFKWLKENAHKYGFILRYPKDKEYLTGYSYESWHYRYVGVEAATYIYENDITFDEYYAYFIESK